MDYKKKFDLILALGTAFIPQLAEEEDLHAELVENFAKFHSDLDMISRKKIELLMSVIDLFALFTHFKHLSSLSQQKRTKVIETLYKLPVAKVIGGITGVRSIFFVSYYSISR